MARLKTFNVEVSDSVTYTRTKTVEVKAKDEDAAIEKALGMVNTAGFCDDMDEEQTDNTPWEAEIVD